MNGTSTYMCMLKFSNANFIKCPQLVFLAVRPVTLSVVRSLASIASMAALVLLVLHMSGKGGSWWYWYSRFRWLR